MLQQLAIIRALLHRPSLLILDEVLSGLDPQMRILLINALYQLVKTEKVTILISSHELNAIEDLCSRFLLFNKGRLDEITQKENKEFEETWQLFLYGKRHESFRKDNIPDWLNKFGPDYEEAKHRISIRCLDYKSVLRAIDQIEPQVSDINKIEIRRYNLEDIFLKNTGNKDVDFTQSNIY